MRSPSFKRALRATIRACVVAISASNAAYADWNASLVSIPASCVVHDSGMEFLPLRFRAIPELDALNEPLPFSSAAFDRNGPADAVREATTDHCVLAAVRHANYEMLTTHIEWARNQVGWFYGTANEWIDHYPVLPISWNRAIRSNSPFVARLLVSALNKSNLPSVPSMDDVLASQSAVAQNAFSHDKLAQYNLVDLETEVNDALLWDCDQHHCGAKYQLQLDLADSECGTEVTSSSTEAIASFNDLGMNGVRADSLSGCEAEGDLKTYGDSAIGVLPSGHPANIFVFTLQASSNMDEVSQVEDPAETVGSPEAFDALVDQSINAALASRTGRSNGDESIAAIDGEFCSQLVSGTEVDAPIFENRFPIEEGCIPSVDFLTGVLSDSLAGDEVDVTPAIAAAPEHLVKTLKDGAAAVNMVPEQSGMTASNDDLVNSESELCLPLVSNCGDHYEAITAQKFFATSNETDDVAADRIPIDPSLILGLDEPNESWRSVFRPHGCIFAPEYLIDQPSVGIRSNTEIEPDPIVEDMTPAEPMNRNFASVDAALRDPIGIGLDLPAPHARIRGREMSEPTMQGAIISDSVRWSESAWVGYANDVVVNERSRESDDVTRTPMTKVFARGLRWFGDWMVQWSDALESQIRMAEGSERSATHDR